jgi:hypothetical protein
MKAVGYNLPVIVDENGVAEAKPQDPVRDLPDVLLRNGPCFRGYGLSVSTESTSTCRSTSHGFGHCRHAVSQRNGPIRFGSYKSPTARNSRLRWLIPFSARALSRLRGSQFPITWTTGIGPPKP